MKTKSYGEVYQDGADNIYYLSKYCRSVLTGQSVQSVLYILYCESWHTRQLSLGVRRSLRISVSCCRLKMEKFKFFYMKGVSEL